MKWATLFVVLNVVTACGLAQGTVAFSNQWGPLHEPLGNPPFVDDHGKLLSGTNYLAQLYAGFTPTTLIRVGHPVPFLSGTNAGYFYDSSGQVVIAIITPGDKAWVQVRAWEVAGGATFEEAAFTGHWTGISSVLYLTTGGAGAGVPGPPAALGGLAYPGSPIVVRHPQNQTIRASERAVLSVVASGGITLQYQWYNGNSGDASSPVSGATNALFATPPLSTNASFWVSAYDSVGSTNSGGAMVTIYPANAAKLGLAVSAGHRRLTIEGVVGAGYEIQYAPTVPTMTWAVLTNLVLPSSPFILDDTSTNLPNSRFYRAVAP